MSQIAAKPCPWCGAEQHGIEGDVDDRSRSKRIHCGYCGLSGPWGKDEADALAKWNTRPVEDQLSEVIKELVEAAENALHVLTPARPRMDGLDRTRMWLRSAIRKATGGTP